MQSIQFQNRKIINNKDGENADIIKALLQAVPEAIQQGKNIAPFFIKKPNTPEIIANRAWSFGKNKIAYQVDEFGTQKIQLPSALLHSKTGDCKSLTILMVSILANALPNVPLYIRFASYDENNPTPTHVYCYIIVNGREIIIDPVYFSFNKEKSYFYNQDFNVMEISTLAGFDSTDIGRTKKKKKFLQKFKGNLKKNLKKDFGKLKTVGLSAPRGSFLLLVKMNARGLANKIKRAPSDKVKKIWNALGGNYEKLLETVQKGSQKKPFLGEKVNQVEGIENIGSVVAVSTLLVSAAGVLAAFAPILKSIEKSRGKGPGEPGVDEVEKETIDSGGKLEIPRGEVSDGEPGSGKEGNASGGFDFSFSNPVVLIGAGAATYLLLNKKK